MVYQCPSKRRLVTTRWVKYFKMYWLNKKGRPRLKTIFVMRFGEIIKSFLYMDWLGGSFGTWKIEETRISGTAYRTRRFKEVIANA